MKIKAENLCLHCDPFPNDLNHASDKLDSLLSPAFALFAPLEWLIQKFPKFYQGYSRFLLSSILRFLITVKILKEVEASDADEGLQNRSMVFVREARQRGISVSALRMLGKSTSHFSITVNGRKEFFESLPCVGVEYGSAFDFDDKGRLKRLLQSEGLPHPEGKVFRNFAAALRYVNDEIGFPVVVKPKEGSLSKHTTCNIKNAEQLEAAIDIAAIICKEFVVEKFIMGFVHRVTLINGELVASCLREPPNVVGDGICTVGELIALKNDDASRGESHQKNFTLHKLFASARTTSILAAQDIQLDGVPAKGQKVYLHDKLILASGGDIHDTTDSIHPENVALFKKVFALCSAPLIGVDFICRDISRPYLEQESAILEVNSLPFIDMHHYPVTGKKRDVAGRLLDYYLSIKRS